MNDLHSGRLQFGQLIFQLAATVKKTSQFDIQAAIAGKAFRPGEKTPQTSLAGAFCRGFLTHQDGDFQHFSPGALEPFPP
jgi:hypothetical protein